MIKGQRVILRAYEKDDDVSLIQKMINEADVLLNLRADLPMPFSFIDEKKFVEGQSSFEKDYNFVIANMENEYIGGCGLMNISWVNSVGTVGIWLKKSEHNKGLGREALSLLVHFIFEHLNLRKIKLNVFAFNENAIKSYEKVGFKVEAVLKKEIYRHNQYWDDYIMSIFKEEYMKGNYEEKN
jgi:RimJ/RimL family protein N-acetyltransferase